MYLVFDGSGSLTTVGDHVVGGPRDVFVVPSWQAFSVRSEADASDPESRALDLFRLCDLPVFEALRLARRESVR